MKRIHFAVTTVALLAAAGQCRAESRSVLVQVKQAGAGPARVTVHSDDKQDRVSAVATAEAVRAIEKMEGWGSLVHVAVATEGNIPRADRVKLLDAINHNGWLQLEYYGPEVPQRLRDYFLHGMDEEDRE